MKNKEIPQDFYKTLKDSPSEVIEWAKKEIALYEELIAIIKKRIAFEESLPKLSKKKT